MSGAVVSLGAAVAGIALGVVYFAGVRWSAELLAAGGGAGVAVALTVGRFALLACVLTLVSLRGAGPLLAMTLGVLIARTAMLRGMRPECAR
jgi:uncharacterized membrane protein (UPF0136 family)